jgi:hypothetical protein
MPEWQEVVSNMKDLILKESIKRNEFPEFLNGRNSGILQVIKYVEDNAKQARR